MKELEKSKERLKSALVKIEKAIDLKISRLELENQALKSELAKLKAEKPASVSRKKSIKADIETLEEEPLVNANVLNEVDLSLKELKKLVG